MLEVARFSSEDQQKHLKGVLASALNPALSPLPESDSLRVDMVDTEKSLGSDSSKYQ